MGGGMGGGMGNTPGTAYGGATDPSMIQLTDGFRIIPTISAAQRYDSNVFLQPKTAGLDRSDYVSTLAPQIRGLFAGSGMKLNATVGVTAEYFVKNTDFNYVGANAGLALNLGPMLDRLWQGMVVTITDSFQYTPQPPSFLVGDQPNNTSASGTPSQVNNTSNLLMNGMQVGRVSSTSNNFGGSLIAPLSQSLSLSGGYSRGFIRFGTSDVQQVGLLLNTSYQTFNVGILTKLTPQDSVTLSYIDSSYKYADAAGGSFTTRGGTVGWMHLFSPTVTMSSTAGVQIFDGGTVGSSSTSTTTTSTGVSQGTTSSSSLVPTGSLALTWRDKTTSLSVAYGLSLLPSYQFDAQPLLSNTISFSVMQVTPVPQLVGLLSVNYSRGDEFGSTSQNSISFSSYGATGGALYKFTPKTFLNCNYQYSKYDSQFGTQGFSFARQLVSLSLTQAFY
ncbi:MAG: hypothetical protein A2V62_02835 [Nitrospirae bacterium RBG_19FT_COMBO_58_9]|nr:MAG: hypothetical protein A2V62_02835 [Nitrospirae bacterium RBG_19FT_COMBO_58_9]